jgi:hypothetical protein
VTERPWPDRSFLRTAALLGLLAAAALAALGRFRSAIALTLGAAVAIVSAFWLSDLVGRLQALRPGAASRFDWKFGLKTVLRYGVVGLALFGAVRTLPAEVPWILVGLSTVVATLMVEGIREHRRGMRGIGRT